MSGRFWEGLNDARVERLIGVLQETVAQHAGGAVDESLEVTGAELTAALLALLASVLEASPNCGTPMGVRRSSDAVAKELLQLMREVRSLKTPPAGLH